MATELSSLRNFSQVNNAVLEQMEFQLKIRLNTDPYFHIVADKRVKIILTSTHRTAEQL